MNDAKYDHITDFYLSFVQRGLDNPASIFHLAINAIFALAGDLSGKRVCDLACGEGYLSRLLAGRGAEVVGVDLSHRLLEHARQRTLASQRAEGQAITYINDDAQVLGRLEGQPFDAVICNMALMDIPDLSATFQAVQKHLKPGGCFVFVILHPCFETPFHAPEDPIELDAEGNFAAIRVMDYFREGYWTSGGDGMRGRVGAQHRTLSTYLNTLVENGFQLDRVIEPSLPPAQPGEIMKRDSRVPSLLAVKAISTPLHTPAAGTNRPSRSRRHPPAPNI